MGTGKSYWGRRWASFYQLPFFETDDMVEAMAGMPVSRIFEEKGEVFFREIERRVLESLEKEGPGIISTGGGMPCFGDNMDRMNAAGITIFLDAEPALLAERLSKAKKKRPLLNNITPDELIPFITERLGERIAYYRKAAYTFSVTDLRDDSLNDLPGLG